MASLTLQRASCCLQISRTPRPFSVSFTTALPRRDHFRRLTSPPTAPFLVSLTSRHTRHSVGPKSATNPEGHRKFANTRVFRAQQAEAANLPSKTTPLDPRPPETSEAITPNRDDLSAGFNDKSLDLNEGEGEVDWTRSFSGLSSEAFSPEASKILLAPVDKDDIEIKPDGILYLPEIKYRRILNQAFGPGGWGLAPRGETIVTAKAVTREYALVALGRLVSVARGEQDYFSPEGIPTAVEGCKSTALRRCCKDLGIASELWDPRFIRKFMAENIKEVFVEHQVTKRRRKIYLRKEEKVQYPYKETRYGS